MQADGDNRHARELENEQIEIRLLLEAVYQKYGYDFRDYTKAYLTRRIRHRMRLSDCRSISEMQHRVLYDPAFMKTLLMDFSVNVTELFRTPSFYRVLRNEIVSILKTYPYIKIWHAGCASGEEVYSMAILLMEEGLYASSQIYATDFNEEVLSTAREGIYPIDRMKQYTVNYQQAGGTCSFSDYYTARYDSAIFDNSLKKNIIFADHNLVTDTVFGEMHMILCRNVFIYFNRELQDRVVKLFSDSLTPGGFLCLGAKESLRFSQHRRLFEPFHADLKIYRKCIENNL